MKNKNKGIVYILGTGHCGSTLLDLLLSSHKDVFGCGELKYIQKGEFICGCGQEKKACTFWSDIRYSGISKSELYAEIFQKSNDSWLVDSSKYGIGIEDFSTEMDVDIVTIYLVRDLRGYIYSCKKKEHPMMLSLYRWLRLTCLMIFKKLFTADNAIVVWYDSLTEQPTRVINGIFTRMNIETVDMSFLENINAYHQIAGNRMKINKNIQVRKDIAWKEKLSQIEQVFLFVLELIPMSIIKQLSKRTTYGR